MKTDRSVAISEREYVRGIEDDSKIRLSERNTKFLWQKCLTFATFSLQ